MNEQNGDLRIPRFEVDIEGGRILIVYASDQSKALLTASQAGFLPKAIREAGYWDEQTCRVKGDSREVSVIGDVHARPQKPKGAL